jgi:hypothetical protein
VFDDEGDPFNGQCQFIYRLYEDADGIGELDEWHMVAPYSQQVTDGYFTSYPEFDCTTCWNGDERWLGITFQCPYVTGPMETMPLQKINAVPYAIYSRNATATPQPTPTLVNTATPQPTATPMETATPQPTPTLVSTATPQPTATPLVNVAFTDVSNLFTTTQMISNTSASALEVTGYITTTRIGIGTSPAYQVHVYGTGGQDIWLQSSDDTTGSFAGVELKATNPDLVSVAHGPSRVVSRFGLTLGGWGEIRLGTVSGGSTPNGLVIGTVPNAPLVLGTNNTERMRILGTGGVSITNKIGAYNNVATEGYGVPAIVDDVAITARGSDIGSTNFTNAGTAGTYRINYYVQTLTTNAGSGAVTLTIAWTDDTTARTQSSASVGLTAPNYATGVIFVRLGGGSVAYSTTHTGSYLTATYNVYITCERLS